MEALLAAQEMLLDQQPAVEHQVLPHRSSGARNGGLIQRRSACYYYLLLGLCATFSAMNGSDEYLFTKLIGGAR